MNRLASFVVLLSLGPLATAEVSLRVCLADANTPLVPADPNTPLVFGDIMVGTKLTIIVSSDTPGAWSGGLFIEGIDRDYGVLSARDYNAATHDWAGSRFAAAGSRARVNDMAAFQGTGFDLASYKTAVPGDWFILDYTATQAGTCRVAFYYFPPLDSWPVDPNDPLPPGVSPEVLLAELIFNQVPTRDFDRDATVGFGDFAVFASYWGAVNCVEPDRCQGADLDADGNVDAADLALFAEYWLKKTQ